MGVSDFGWGVIIAEKYRFLAEKRMFDGNAQASITGHTRRSPPSGITPLLALSFQASPFALAASPLTPRLFTVDIDFMVLGLDQSEKTGSSVDQASGISPLLVRRLELHGVDSRVCWFPFLCYTTAFAVSLLHISRVTTLTCHVSDSSSVCAPLHRSKECMS